MVRLDFSALSRGATEGTFPRFEIPALLVRVARQGRTGRLTLAEGKNVRTVGFSGGLPTLAGSQVPSERLGQRLLKLDLIGRTQLDRVDALMCKEPIQFGEAMVRLGFMTDEELRRTLRTHHGWLLTQCLTSSEVRCGFSPYVWVAKDPSSFALLQALEDGVRTYGADAVRELLDHAGSWRFTVGSEDVALARRLACTKTVADALEQLRGAPRTPAQVVAVCDDGAPEVAGLTLLLCGLFSAELVRSVALPGAALGEVASAPGTGAAAAGPADRSQPAAGHAAAAADLVTARHTAPPGDVALPSVLGRLVRDLGETVLARRLGLDAARMRVLLAALLFAAGAAVTSAFLWAGEGGHDPQWPDREPPEPPLLASPPPGVTIVEAWSAAAGPAGDGPRPAKESVPPRGVAPRVADGSAPGERSAPASGSALAKPAAPAMGAAGAAPKGTASPAGVVTPAPASGAAAAKATPRPRPQPAEPRPSEPRAGGAATASPDPAAVALKTCSRLTQSGDYREAITACQRLLADNPRHALAYRLLGISYTKLGARSQACESYRRYLRFAANPSDRAQVEALVRACE